MKEGITEIARRARGTPRIANRLLRRCRDFAQADKSLAHTQGKITHEVARHSLEMLEVDEHGLDEMDKLGVEKIEVAGAAADMGDRHDVLAPPEGLPELRDREPVGA